jgi:hypothetical protein
MAARQTPITYLNVSAVNISTTTGQQFSSYNSSITTSNLQINNTLTLQPTTAKSANLFSTSMNLFGNFTVYGTMTNNGDNTTYIADRANASLSYANGATVNFSNFSGMIIVNNTSLTGIVQLWLCGGGSTTAIGVSGLSGGTGIITHNAGITGYTWSNNTGSTQNFSFAAIRTRSEA